jgi:hypothetical protein
MWPFNRKRKRKVAGNPEAVPEDGLDVDSRRYRQERIAIIATHTEKSIEDATLLADSWIVHMCSVQVGDSEPETKFVPSPIWDDEWMMWRSGFTTREEALAEVQRVGGKLLAG